MVKKTLSVLAALLTLGCASTGGTTDSGDFWLTMPGAGTITIVGVSGPQLRSSTVINNAREHAARNASMFHRIDAHFYNRHAIGTGIFDFENFFEYTITYDENLEAFMERLDHDLDRDLLRVGNITGIRFSYPASLPGPVSFSTAKNPDGSPVWTNAPPVISGYLVGVGHSGRQLRVGDTFNGSVNSAIAAMTAQIEQNITSITREVNGVMTTIHVIESKGVLTNFFVLETWFDPVSQSVWTLAIARQGN
ncbi:MAG: LPP20 family lipoprotein [Spirochaetes bacterium]|nr:LPP20 family lipoprotein [Spirochaetota bacterium]